MKLSASNVWSLYAWLLCGGLISCVSNSSYSDLKAQYDSVAKLNQAIESDFYQTDSLVASVLGHFQEISHIENMINVNISAGEAPRTEQQRIRDNMREIHDRLNKSSEVIEILSRQLTLNGQDNQRLVATLSVLRLQLEQQRAYVANFEQDIEERTNAISILDKRINRLHQQATRIKRDQDLYAELLATREHHQNQVRYCLGTRQDLQDMGIMRGEEINIADTHHDYFTIADQQSLREIMLEGSTAKLLSIHPINSYEIESPKNGKSKLRILDNEGFWSYSRTLIIQIHNSEE